MLPVRSTTLKRKHGISSRECTSACKTLGSHPHRPALARRASFTCSFPATVLQACDGTRTVQTAGRDLRGLLVWRCVCPTVDLLPPLPPSTPPDRFRDPSLKLAKKFYKAVPSLAVVDVHSN
jgi:hypothetical protein